MALDITTIGIEYDTSGLEKGTRAQDKTTQSANKLGESVDRTEKSFSSLNKMLGYAAGALAAVGGVMLAKQFVQTADAITLMDARLKLATGSLEDFHKAQKDIYAIAQANNVGLQETTSLYTKLSDPVRRLGGTSKEVAAIVDSFATSLRVGGASAQEASAATLQFAQAMASGRLQGDEFRSIAEASPRFMKALADGMGVPIEKLKELGSEGKLSADVVGNALVKSLDQLKKEAQGLPDTVSGAITRFKNDILLAVGEISGAQGFTTGFAGLIESARGLIPVIKDEVLGAFVAVNGWIDRNREGLAVYWDNVKGIVGGVWELAKGAASVVGFITEWAGQSGLVKTAMETIRFLIAGVQDGVKIIGAGFAWVGSQIFQMVLSPLQKVLEMSAKVAGVFDDEMAANLRGIAKEVDDYAKSGENYAKSVTQAFGEGNSAVGRLNAELGKTTTETKAVAKTAKEAAGDYKGLKSSVTEASKEITTAAKAAQSIREAAAKRESDFIKQIDKESKQYASDQIARSKEVTKQIIDDINNQSKTYLSFNKSLDDHAQRMADTNTLAQMEIDLLNVSAVERNTLIEQKKIELALERQLKEIKESTMTSEAKNLLADKAKTQANIDKSTAQLRAQQGEWTKFYGEIYNGLSDSLYRGFEAGKGFGRSFLDSIKNLFKTNVLKIAVQAVMGGAGGMVSGFASAATGGEAGGGLGSMINMGKTIYEGFSSGFTGFGNSVANYVQAGLDKAGLSMTGGGNSALASGAGTAASYLGGAAVGIYGGRAISGGYSVTGGNAAVNIGTLAGAIFGGPIGAAIGGLIGGGVNRLFGRKAAELQSSELIGSVGSGGFSASTKDTYLAKGGLFRSDKWTSTTTAMSDTSGLTKEFDAIKTAASGYASMLGLSSTAIDSYTKSFTINLSKTGDAAKDAEANQKKLAELFIGISDDITNLVAPSISALSKEGETASQTLSRLAMGLTSVNGIMNAAGFAEFAKSLEGAGAAVRLAELAGGIEKLATGTQYFIENFLNAEEKIKPSMDLVTETMGRLGQSSVDTIDEFKKLVQGLDLAVESEAKLYTELLAIAPQFKAVADYVTETTKAIEENSAAVQRAKQIEDERKSLQDEYNQLTMTSTELMQLQRSALDESNLALYDAIQATKQKQSADSAAAAQMAAIASQRSTLQDELDQLTMNETQLLEKKRATYYDHNLDLFDQIQAEKTKIEMERENAEMFAAIAKEQAEMQAAVTKQQEDAARIAQENAKQMQDAANKMREAWQGLTNSVYDEVRRIRGLSAVSGAQGMATAQTNFTIASAKAAAGDQQAYGMLPELSKALLSIAEQQAPTLNALRLIQAQTAASLVATAGKLGFPIPSYAVGTNYVPQDGIVQVHQGEKILTRQENARGEVANKQLMADLIQRVEMLSFELKAIAGHTSNTSRILDRVVVDDKVQIGTPAGEPIEVI